jgi:hypothetical protein
LLVLVTYGYNFSYSREQGQPRSSPSVQANKQKNNKKGIIIIK